jgi:hypothetical protein
LGERWLLGRKNGKGDQRLNDLPAIPIFRLRTRAELKKLRADAMDIRDETI